MQRLDAKGPSCLNYDPWRQAACTHAGQHPSRKPEVAWRFEMRKDVLTMMLVVGLMGVADRSLTAQKEGSPSPSTMLTVSPLERRRCRQTAEAECQLRSI